MTSSEPADEGAPDGAAGEAEASEPGPELAKNGNEGPDSDAVELDEAESSRLKAQRERIAAWNQAGATSIPALVVAVVSAISGAIALFWRRRHRS